MLELSLPKIIDKEWRGEATIAEKELLWNDAYTRAEWLAHLDTRIEQAKMQVTTKEREKSQRSEAYRKIQETFEQEKIFYQENIALYGADKWKKVVNSYKGETGLYDEYLEQYRRFLDMANALISKALDKKNEILLFNALEREAQEEALAIHQQEVAFLAEQRREVQEAANTGFLMNWRRAYWRGGRIISAQVLKLIHAGVPLEEIQERLHEFFEGPLYTWAFDESKTSVPKFLDGFENHSQNEGEPQ